MRLCRIIVFADLISISYGKPGKVYVHAYQKQHFMYLPYSPPLKHILFYLQHKVHASVGTTIEKNSSATNNMAETVTVRSGTTVLLYFDSVFFVYGTLNHLHISYPAVFNIWG